MQWKRTISIAAALLAVALCREAMAQHADDVWVGRTAGGQLTVGGFDVENNLIALPPTSGLFNGWADNDPGFDRVLADNPADDIFMLQSGVQVRIELVATDPAFRAIDNSFKVMDDPGEWLLLGNQNLHTHLTWHINSDSGAFDPNQYLWNATYKLVDAGTTAYAESEPFTLHFSNIDCTPGDVNGDTFVDMMDAEAFVGLLLDSSAATNAERCAADLDYDHDIDGDDIQRFVEAFMSA